MHRGFIKLWRCIDENEFYFTEKFTKAQAWIDLVMLANHKDKMIFIRGNEVWIKRGNVGWSEQSLAKRWKWSRNKVRNFKKYLEKVQQIEQQNSKVLSQIKIINYDMYQEKGTTEGTTERQQKVQQKDTNKNDKNEKNDKKEKGEVAKATPTPVQLAREFFKENGMEHYKNILIEKGVSPAAADSELMKFWNYWTEPNKSGTKQRWELERTFDINRRLNTWFTNAQKFNPNQTHHVA